MISRDIVFIRLVVVFILIYTRLVAQPGGGGGLLIHSLESSDGKKISDLLDNSLKIKAFNLNDGQIIEEAHVDIGKNRYSNYSDGLKNSIYIKPPLFNTACREGCLGQRLLVIYKKDTMIADFFGVLDENPEGLPDKLKNLVVKKGNCFYTKINQKKELNADGFSNWKLKTCYELDISLITEEKNFSNVYFKNEAQKLFWKKDFKSALRQINRYIDKVDAKEYETLVLLSDIYNGLEKYDEAIECVSKAIEMYKIGYGGEAYKKRTMLWIKIGAFDKVMEDYNSLLKITEEPLIVWENLAWFKMRYLKDYTGLIKDMKSIIDLIPDNYLKDCPNCVSKHAGIYFALGNAYLHNGELELAAKYILKAVEMGYTRHAEPDLGKDSLRSYFNSLVNENKKAPEFYMARAISNIDNVSSEGKTTYDKVMGDIDMAERHGLTGNRVNRYRAEFFKLNHQYREAIMEADIAIKKDSTDFECYLIRYKCREQLQESKWNDKYDHDILKYEALKKDWKFEKYLK